VPSSRDIIQEYQRQTDKVLVEKIVQSRDTGSGPACPLFVSAAERMAAGEVRATGVATTTVPCEGGRVQSLPSDTPYQKSHLANNHLQCPPTNNTLFALRQNAVWYELRSYLLAPAKIHLVQQSEGISSIVQSHTAMIKEVFGEGVQSFVPGSRVHG
jgi:hypothetical protein